MIHWFVDASLMQKPLYHRGKEAQQGCLREWIGSEAKNHVPLSLSWSSTMVSNLLGMGGLAKKFKEVGLGGADDISLNYVSNIRSSKSTPINFFAKQGRAKCVLLPS